MIRLTKYKTPLLTMLKRGKKPVNWAQEVELEGAITPGDLAAQEGADFDESGFDAEGTLALGNLLTDSVEDSLRCERAVRLTEGFSQGKAAEDLCKRCDFAKRHFG